MLVNDMPPFLEHCPIWPNPPFLWENSESIFFGKILKTQTFSFIKQGVPIMITPLTFTCSKSTIKTLEKCVKYVQS